MSKSEGTVERVFLQVKFGHFSKLLKTGVYPVHPFSVHQQEKKNRNQTVNSHNPQTLGWQRRLAQPVLGVIFAASPSISLKGLKWTATPEKLVPSSSHLGEFPV